MTLCIGNDNMTSTRSKITFQFQKILDDIVRHA